MILSHVHSRLGEEEVMAQDKDRHVAHGVNYLESMIDAFSAWDT